LDKNKKYWLNEIATSHKTLLAMMDLISVFIFIWCHQGDMRVYPSIGRD